MISCSYHTHGSNSQLNLNLREWKDHNNKCINIALTTEKNVEKITLHNHHSMYTPITFKHHNISHPLTNQMHKPKTLSGKTHKSRYSPHARESRQAMNRFTENLFIIRNLLLKP